MDLARLYGMGAMPKSFDPEAPDLSLALVR